MPFDGTTGNTLALNRARLIEALRQPIPNWNFSRFDQCACHVAEMIGLISFHLDLDGLAQVLGISKGDVKNIFVGGDNTTRRSDFYDVDCRSEITPQMVADKLEKVR